MRLVIVRHAVAVPRGTPGIPDGERPLTPEGAARFREAARGLARLVERPDLILTSPWRRARQTARIAAEAWGCRRLEEHAAFAGGTFEQQAAVLDSRQGEATVVVVGHEPYLSALLARILDTAREDRLTFKKGGAALVEVPGSLAEGGSLVFFLPPKVLRKL
jgi:phosphohistidine phosphatase